MRMTILAVTLAMMATTAHAGPRRRTVVTTRPTASVRSVSSPTTTREVVGGGGAQAHAEAMASTGSMVHAQSHGATYEGVGMGESPQAALQACCNNGGAVVEEGVAQASSGRWFACRRYSLR